MNDPLVNINQTVNNIALAYDTGLSNDCLTANETTRPQASTVVIMCRGTMFVNRANLVRLYLQDIM
jgi:hypothetical protein